MGSGIKYKVTKVEVNSTGEWKAFREMRSSDGVMQALKDNAGQIGEIDAAYKGWDRAHVRIKTDIDTFNALVAAGKVIPKGESDE